MIEYINDGFDLDEAEEMVGFDLGLSKSGSFEDEEEEEAYWKELEEYDKIFK